MLRFKPRALHTLPLSKRSITELHSWPCAKIFFVFIQPCDQAQDKVENIPSPQMTPRYAPSQIIAPTPRKLLLLFQKHLYSKIICDSKVTNGSTGGWTQGLTLSRQTLYHLSHVPSPQMSAFACSAISYKCKWTLWSLPLSVCEKQPSCMCNKFFSSIVLSHFVTRHNFVHFLADKDLQMILTPIDNA
jgi:hypothetical protein